MLARAKTHSPKLVIHLYINQNYLKQKHRVALQGFSDVKIVAVADETCHYQQDSFDYVLNKPLD